VTIQVRPVRPEEAEEAGRVTALAYREFATSGKAWDEYLGRIADVRDRASRTLVLVAVEGERVLGSATLELLGRTEEDHDQPLASGEGHVRMLGVDPSARRRGVARLLMRACIDRAREAGKTYITLNTTPRMTSAQKMYESMGFERGADTVFPDGFVLLSYEKAIGENPG
jgi:ribosomal protein S18 acetylase RimI-like enzyme